MKLSSVRSFLGFHPVRAQNKSPLTTLQAGTDAISKTAVKQRAGAFCFNGVSPLLGSNLMRRMSLRDDLGIHP